MSIRNILVGSRLWLPARGKGFFFTATLMLMAMPLVQASAIPIIGGQGQMVGHDAGGRVSGNGSFAVGGAGGNSLSGAGDFTSIGICGIATGNGFQYCTPGTTYRGAAGLSSEDRGLSGTICAMGVCTGYQGLPGMGTGAGIDYNLTFTVPNVGAVAPPTLMFTAPFTSQAGGGVIPSPSFPQGLSVMLEGQGTATIILELSCNSAGCGGISYRFQSAQFNFTAIPEPATMVPGALGLLVLAMLGRSAR